jgi:hypothetical protein
MNLYITTRRVGTESSLDFVCTDFVWSFFGFVFWIAGLFLSFSAFNLSIYIDSPFFFVLSGGQNITLLYLNGVSVLLFSMGMILTMAAWPERACNNVVLPGAGKGNSACWPRVESMCL